MQRIINLVTEVGFRHQTNWGAMTKMVQSQEYQPTRKIVIAQMNISTRKKLEEIAKKTEVRYPNTKGGWNCQDWIEAILAAAVDEGLLNQRSKDEVLERAKTINPLNGRSHSS
jgi:hypothetical protein